MIVGADLELYLEFLICALGENLKERPYIIWVSTISLKYSEIFEGSA